MIKRTSKAFIENTLSLNSSWNILDIGCGYGASKYANIVCDVQDLSKYYPNKTFIKLTEKKLPFKDKEFDFVIASHVMEHVDDIEFFISELERVSQQGYIELPTMLEDNLVFENKKVTFVRTPKFEEVPYPVVMEPNLVIEYYSR